MMSEKSLDTVLDDLSKFYILLVLHEGPSHGYGIMSKYRQRTGKTLSAGTLYPFVQQLEEQGIVTSEDKPVGKRPRRIYCLTREGRKAVNQLLQRFASITTAAFESNLQVCSKGTSKTVRRPKRRSEMVGSILAMWVKSTKTAI